MKYVHLLLVDEIHFLKEESRGATLEVVVSRMKTMQQVMKNDGEYKFPELRIVAISATIPNLDDFSSWLSSSAGVPAEKQYPNTNQCVWR
jgi:ATP-dependent DNA helicase HFM1/MER3